MYRIIFAPAYLLSLLPQKILYLLSDGLAFLLRKVLHYRVTVVYTNLSRAFPELKYQEIDQIAKAFYQHFADIFIEALWSLSAGTEAIARKITIVNPELLSKIYTKYQKALIVMGHVGNWELMGSGLCQPVSGKPTEYRKANFIILYKKLKTKWLSNAMEGYRKALYKRMGNNGIILDAQNTVEYMATHEHDPNLYFFIADQSCNSRLAADFLHQKTLFFEGPESTARLFDLPVVYLGMHQYKRGRYRITFSLITETSADTKKGYITGKYASLLEKDIRANKFNWLWTHKRWKADLSNPGHHLYDLNEQVPEREKPDPGMIRMQH